MPNWIPVADTADLTPNQSKAVEVEDVSILIVNKGGKFYALHNVCTHMDFSLEDGEIDGETVMCPLHGAKFDIETGAVRAMPAARGLKTFTVDIDGTSIRLDEAELAEF